MNLDAINKILVPVDFNVNSVNALSLACAVASHHNAAVHLLHIADSDEDIGKPAWREVSHDFAGISKKLREFGQSVAATYKINCICSTEYGCVTHLILKKANQLQVDLIVMGKNGTNGPSVLFAGTHACQVAKKSQMPVLIVPDKIARSGFNQVLFPLRPLDSMLAKYDRMRPLIMKNHTCMTILQLRNPQHENELHINHTLGEMIESRLHSDGITYSMEYYFEDDHFADKVLMESGDPEKKYDLTVIVSDHSTPGQTFQFGQYEQDILHHTKTPLLLLHSMDTVTPGTAVSRQLERAKQS